VEVILSDLDSSRLCFGAFLPQDGKFDFDCALRTPQLAVMRVRIIFCWSCIRIWCPPYPYFYQRFTSTIVVWEWLNVDIATVVIGAHATKSERQTTCFLLLIPSFFFDLAIKTKRQGRVYAGPLLPCAIHVR